MSAFWGNETESVFVLCSAEMKEKNPIQQLFFFYLDDFWTLLEFWGNAVTAITELLS